MPRPTGTRQGPMRPTIRARHEHLRGRAKIYLKDPLVSQKGGLAEATVYVDKDTSIAVGPTSARFLVVDYDPTTDRVEIPAAYRPEVVNLNRIERALVLDFQARSSTPQEAQINAWATAVDTLDLFQQPIALGREVPWAFDGSRLRILPHALCEANAFYSRQTRALHFGYFRGKDNKVVKTALSHDVVAHETAHAVLDGLRPFYLDAHEPDAPAFHEFIGDLAAMLSMFRERSAIAGIVSAPSHEVAFRELVAELAPQVGAGLYGEADRSFLRSAKNNLTYADVRDEPECHRRSQVLSGFAFDVLEEIYKIRVRIRRRKQPKKRLTGQDTFRELLASARGAVRLLLRPLDLLPPGSVRFHEYAAVLLRLDNLAYPSDDLGYRRAVLKVMQRRGIVPSRDEMQSWNLDSTQQTPGGAPGKFIENRDLIERDFAMIRSSRVGAYRFLNANRPILAIPKDVDFRVIGIATNQREGDRGLRLLPETIIQYVWDEYVALNGAAKSRGIDKIVMHPGGTIALDDNVNVRFWHPQLLTEPQRDRVRRHVTALVEAGAVETEPTPHVRSDQPVLLAYDQSGVVQLRMNTAAMHRARAERGVHS